MRLIRHILICLCLTLVAIPAARAQFRSGVSTSDNSSLTSIPGENTTTTNGQDTANVQTDTLAGFSMRRLVRGYMRRDTLTPTYMMIGAVVFPGAAQIYNRDWWKLPVVYGGIGTGVYMGIHSNVLYQQTGDEKYRLQRDLSYIGAGVFYWASLLDGVVSYKTPVPKPVPAKATLYSALLPGLGQAYNGDWWKIPIWVGGFAACGYFYHFNDMEYRRFKYLYTVGSDPSSGYVGAISASQAEWYKDLYRKYRDYSVLAIVGVYALNIIDAYVFSFMHDFDISDNIADELTIAPAFIAPPEPWIASNSGQSALGFKMNLNF